MKRLLKTVVKKVLGEKRARQYYGLVRLEVFSLRLVNRRLSRDDRMGKLRSLADYESRVTSENGEDGIIQAIFEKIGTTNKFCVELGSEDGMQCNTAYLVKKRRWSHLWLDACTYGSKLAQEEWITAENVNHLLIKYGIPREFDLLSIDIDYNTYWVWRAIRGFEPRVVIIEYNASLGPSEALVVPYEPYAAWDGRSNFYGASLGALVKLGTEKGYTLIYCESKGVNAFFVKDELKENFMFQSTEQIYRPPGFGKKANGRFVGYPPSERSFIKL